MKQIFKQLVIDFQKQSLPIPTSRELPSLMPPVGLRKAIVLVGMRRSGKTWSLYQQMHQLLAEGVGRSQMVYINFEDDRLSGVTVNDLQFILDAYFELHPDLVDSQSLHFFFDEIHVVEGWERFIRRLLDKEAMQIYITGSSAKMLSKEIATSLRGRTLVREIYPFNFREYLLHRGYTPTDSITSKERAILHAYMQDYLYFGGFPETVGLEKTFHREILQGYVDTVIYRDIIERHRITAVHALRRLLAHCLQNPASSLSINKIYHQFKSQGISVGKNSLYAFMDYLEDAYCLFSVQAFDFSAKKAALKPHKIYPLDPGLISAFSIDSDFQKGPILETQVFSCLKRDAARISYFQTKKGQEVDFLISHLDNTKSLYQVSLTLKDSQTRHRELDALQQAMEETELKEGFVVTLEEEEEIQVPQGTIYIFPLLKFLLKRD